MTGKFITIEGIEGTGKSTAIHYFRQKLQAIGINPVITREPGGTPIAEEIRQILLSHRDESLCPDAELLLMFASRAQHMDQVILPALTRGEWVISDRFTDATYAYQGGGRGISQARIAVLEEWVQQGLQPELTILLDAPVDIGFKRVTKRGVKDRIEKEQHDFFERIRLEYLNRAKQYPNRFRIVDASLTLNEVQHQYDLILKELLKR